MNGLYIAASGAAAQVAALDAAANNLANIDTPGFRQFEVVMNAITANASPYQYAAVSASPQIDMQQGPLTQTGYPLDVAISGLAFMVVQTPDGPAYTRDGQLCVDGNGNLLAGGQPLLGTNGAPIVVPPGKFSIARDGTVSVDAAPHGQIALADPSGASLVAMGGALYRTSNGDTLPPAGPGSTLHEGFLEGSGENPVSAVVGMINIMRGYEATMKAVHAIDQNKSQALQAFTIQA